LNNNIKTTIIISSQNHPEILRTTLESVLYQAIPPDEIIITDNSSENATRKFIKKFAKSCFIPIKHIGAKDNLANMAINQAKYEYLIFVSDNVVLHKKFIGDHICYAKKGRFVTSKDILLSKQQANKLFNNKEKSSIKLINPSYTKSFFFAFYSFLSKKKKQSSNSEQYGFSFYKQDYFNNNLQRSPDLKGKTIIERLEKTGLMRKNLKFYGIQFIRKEQAQEKKTVLVCLDRLKQINCGLGQVALNYGRELLDVKTNVFEFSFLLPQKGFSEFEHKTKYIKLNLFRRIFSNYMKPFDLCHITHQFPSYSFGKAKKNILTIHDLNFIYTKSKSKNEKYLQTLQKNINKSDAVVFISEFTRQTVLKHLNIPENKTQKVIYNGVQPPCSYKNRPGWLPNKQFVFSIGQFLKKKNFHVLLPFIKLLPKDYILVIAGEKDTSYGTELLQSIKKLELQERVIFPGGISEEDRNFLYNKCEAFLFPSIAEGFGLPVIEAMLCSKPVFCSDRTSLREIGNNFAFFWNSFEPNKMLEVFNAGLETFKTENYQERQKEYANTYTYKKNVQEYLQLYENLLQQI
jgi:glycosyltransferase involved in cell wall biosynthesis